MTEMGKISVGRARRITGFVLIVLGALLAGRAGWLAAFYGSWFGHDEWLRFAFLIWLGALLSLVGCWLAYRSRVAAWAAVLSVVLLFVMVYVHDTWLR